MPQPIQLIHILSDGRFHSGEALGAALDVSRVAVWKGVKSLADFGLNVLAVRGKGYRLVEPLELLDRDALLRALDPGARQLMSRLDMLLSVDSTNRYLKQSAVMGAAKGRACIAEHQSSGRGRQGRLWTSPFGSNVYLSVFWRFNTSPAALSGLSLAVGVAVIRALQVAGLPGAGLKWPNDVLWQGRKLAGVLIELAGESAGPCEVVVGVGLNVRMPKEAAAEIDQPWVDAHTIAGTHPVSRNRLAGLLLQELLLALDEFERRGFEAFRSDWLLMDVMNDKDVEIRLPDRVICGLAAGIDGSGALLLAEGGTIRAYSAGEVTLRLRQ